MRSHVNRHKEYYSYLPLLEIFLDGELLKKTNSVIYLGVHIDRNLSWNMHVIVISRRVYTRLKLLNRVTQLESATYDI